MPYGFYKKINDLNIKHDDYVSFCLDKVHTEIGLKQGYLERGHTCNGSVPLIKKVIALPYQSVYLTNSYIKVDDSKINAVTSLYDSKSRLLTHMPGGTYKQNCYWVIGDKDVKHSWDSRYWGCISSKQIIAKVKPLLTW